jgi:hypothetical protein
MAEFAKSWRREVKNPTCPDMRGGAAQVGRTRKGPAEAEPSRALPKFESYAAFEIAGIFRPEVQSWQLSGFMESVV